jgi:DNA polymerase (family 10)
MKNLEIAQLFARMADALELKGESRFRISAYRNASRALAEMAEDVASVYKEGKLREIPGIGEGTAEKIAEYLQTGRMHKYTEVTVGFSEGFMRLLDIPGLGPKTLMLAHERLRVNDLADLKRVLADGSLASLPGMGSQKVDNLLKGVALFEKAHGRIPLGVALPLVAELTAWLQDRGVTRILPAGSLRRMKETVGDLDILAAGRDGSRIVKQFLESPLTRRVLAAGPTKGSILASFGGLDEMQVDLRVVAEESFGAAAAYFTGSKQHNIHLRTLARERDLKISEYGVFRGERMIAGATEEEVYAALKLPWIPPELREDRGEIEAAAAGTLPDLVELRDIKGDLHVHSKYSDGQLTIGEMAEAIRGRGCRYMAITDHSQSAKYAHGMSVERAQAQLEEIRKLNRRFTDFTILAGVEADILADGAIDFPDSLLKRYDVVIASVHSGFTRDCTARILKAMDHPRVNIIGHPTGRLLSGREGYPVDMERVIAHAAKTRTALEINAYYDRLDLNDAHCRMAKAAGVKCVINTDAHSTEMLQYLALGVGTARRGWLEKMDILNTYPLPRLKDWLATT